MAIGITERSGTVYLVIAITIFCALEVVTLESGLYLLPDLPMLRKLAMPIGIMLGIVIEQSLAALRKENITIRTLPWLYMLPLLAGFVGRFIGWVWWLSVILFVGLLGWVVWRWVRR